MKAKGIGKKGRVCPDCRRVLFWDPIRECWYCESCENDPGGLGKPGNMSSGN